MTAHASFDFDTRCRRFKWNGLFLNWGNSLEIDKGDGLRFMHIGIMFG